MNELHQLHKPEMSVEEEQAVRCREAGIDEHWPVVEPQPLFKEM